MWKINQTSRSHIKAKGNPHLAHPSAVFAFFQLLETKRSDFSQQAELVRPPNLLCLLLLPINMRPENSIESDKIGKTTKYVSNPREEETVGTADFEERLLPSTSEAWAHPGTEPAFLGPQISPRRWKPVHGFAASFVPLSHKGLLVPFSPLYASRRDIDVREAQELRQPYDRHRRVVVAWDLSLYGEYVTVLTVTDVYTL
ncbi:hypothetical protein MUK42_34384 [Musa troglodytarum]|uniref:Uncharacterized protein n=1 Tax=Musa troglodytarum TaxID=320322 RepID=A0A9E7G0E7_9LILI|nr:hypothetical protein MUK42_34384 [Musa troglodytarum]